jgi:hypothetical protein
MEWTVHLGRRHPGRAVAVAAVVLLASLLAQVVFRSPLGFWMTAALLLGATAEFLFPVRYRLTPTFAEARGVLFWRRIEWKEVKRLLVGNREIKLSPLKHPSPREAFRGVVLRCEEDQDGLLAAVRRFREAAHTDAAARD